MNLQEVFEKAMTMEFISVEEWKKVNNVKDIIIYCVGGVGISLADRLIEIGLPVVAFSDTNKREWWKKINGFEVVPPDHLASRFDNPMVIICLCNTWKRHLPVIKENLHALGCMRVIHYSELRCLQEMQDRQELFYSLVDIVSILKNRHKIEQLETYLKDDFSRDTLMRILLDRLGFLSLYESPTSGQYFEETIYNKNGRETFVDCGAYNGDTLETFLKLYNSFESYYAFEPDSRNADKLQDRLDSYSDEITQRIHIIRKAVSNECGNISFESNEIGTGSHMSDTGRETVPSVTLDTELHGYSPTLIKMDIEGAEQNALNGARELINANRPVLTICVYHCPCDLWEIPLWMKENYPFYNLFLRAYEDNDYVCYAVPPERINTDDSFEIMEI